MRRKIFVSRTKRNLQNTQDSSETHVRWREKDWSNENWTLKRWKILLAGTKTDLHNTTRHSNAQVRVRENTMRLRVTGNKKVAKQLCKRISQNSKIKRMDSLELRALKMAECCMPKQSHEKSSGLRANWWCCKVVKHRSFTISEILHTNI